MNNNNDYYVNLLDKNLSTTEKINKNITRRTLPKIDSMLEWGVIKSGDIIVAKGLDNEAILLSNGNVKVDSKEKSLQVWLKELYGWYSVQTYIFAISSLIYSF